MDTYQVAVIGAGVAGICAAIQAGRSGATCILVEKNGMVGGTLSMGGVNCPGLFHAWNGRQVIAGIGWELVKDTLDTCGDSHPDFSRFNAADFWKFQVEINPVIFAALCDQKLLDAGVEFCGHTMLAGLQKENGLWNIQLCGKDGLFRITAETVIDCTGDANAVRQAGFPLRIPDECQPGTFSVSCSGFEFENLDIPMIRKAYQEAIAAGDIAPTDIGWSHDFSTLFLDRMGKNANHICGINGGDSRGRTQMELAGRASIFRTFRFLKRLPGLENLTVQFAGMECGVRESRTIVGETMVSGKEYLAGMVYPDAVSYAFYPADLHDAERGIIKIDLEDGIIPTVPLRALIPKASSGLLAAGRIISSDRIANSALRIQAVCMATGQVAGALAALAAGNRCEVMAVPLHDLHNELRRNHAIVPDLG